MALENSRYLLERKLRSRRSMGFWLLVAGWESLHGTKPNEQYTENQP